MCQRSPDSQFQNSGVPGCQSAAERVYLRARIYGRTRLCLLDSGSEVTLIPTGFIGNRRIQWTQRKIWAANGTEIPVKGWISLTAYVDGSRVEICGLVTDHVSDIFLGLDWLQLNQIEWNFGKGEIILDGKRHRLVAKKTRGSWCRRVVAESDVVIPARSQFDLSTRAVYSRLPQHSGAVEQVWATEPREIKDGLLVAGTLLPNRSTHLPVRVLNTTEKPIFVRHGTTVGDVSTVTTDPVPAEPAAKEQPTSDEVINEMVSKVDKSISEDIKEQLRELLRRYSSVISLHELDLGWTDLVTHTIDTGDAPPIRQQLRRHPPAHQVEIDKQVSNLLAQKVIEPAASPWSSNVVLAKKADGSWRCCIDFRQLNDVTRKDAYPLPRTDQCFDALAGSCLFSSLDLRSGYHQCALSPVDADKTAFVTRRGMFRFQVLPFGLCNAVATFQRLMDIVLSGLNFEVCLVYIDDVILMSTTPEQHLERLEMVLERFKQVNLKLKPSKCHLMQTEIIFLGHRISKDGIATDPAKIQLIKDWPVPINLRQLRGFLGLAGYYRRFVRGYSAIAAPLNHLMKKNQRFEWSEECQKAFDQLKEALMSPPVLVLPTEDDQFILDTDSSEESIGAVLSVVRDGHENVVAYAGRTLNKNELNYCVTRKELLAIVHFTKHFRQYLLGRQFVIRTDHAALAWLQRTPEPVGQNARWLELLGEYSFVVQHRRGVSHGNADAISRHPCLKKPSCTACHPQDDNFQCAVTTAITGDQKPDGDRSTNRDDDRGQSTDAEQRSSEIGGPVIWSREELSRGQLNDPDIGFIMRLRQESEDKPTWDHVSILSADAKQLWHEWERLILDDGVLYRRWIAVDGAADRQQIILPRSFRSEFIRLVHSGMTGGHLGRQKTEEQVQRRAYWPRWRSDVTWELRKCSECAQYHWGKPPKQTYLHPFNAGEPFEVVAVDITGRHPKSARGNEYIVTASCLFSRWAEAFPVRNHTASTVARVLVEQLFTRFGVPKRILTDLGAEFQGQLFTELCKRFEIDQVRTTAYEPRTNGQVERFHRTLNSMLGKSVQQNQRDWDDRLPYVMAAYRASRHESAKFTPNMLVFGRENRAPADLVLNSVQGESEQYDSIDNYVLELQSKLREAHQLARSHLRTTAERRKETYDTKVKRAIFDVGQWVWYLVPRKFVGRYPKWTKNYQGPYLVVKVVSPADYLIQRHRKAVPIVVHGDKLKPCYGDTPASWLVDQPGRGRSGDQPAEARQVGDVMGSSGGATSSPALSTAVVQPGGQQAVQRRRLVQDDVSGDISVREEARTPDPETSTAVMRPGELQPVQHGPVEDGVNEDVDRACPRPVRERRLPAHLADYRL